jgi:dihydrofolate reductase
MRRLVAVEFLSLDGVMQSLGSPEEDPSGGFRHGGWAQPYGDEVLGGFAAERMAPTDAYLFGRRTYEKMAAFWPAQPDANPMAAHLNATPKHVASRTLHSVTWPGAQLLGQDVPEAVADLKRQSGGRITILGSGELVRSLLAAGLVDELELFIHPLVLGGGKRLFADDGVLHRFELTGSVTTTTGVLLLTYRAVSVS